ncbi:MAG: lysophospholipid acyltransferase family protein [Deltaproteobacteria bacterium]|nr:lysophospholipid acyltransferase family protein [Deltaproteobacteria bacterium]
MKSINKNNAFIRWYDHILFCTVVPCIALLIKMLMLSCRVIRYEGEDREKTALERSGGNAIYISWHQRIPYLSHLVGSRDITVMVSQSRDGEYAARLIKWMGIGSVRGSSTRGGKEALVNIIQRLKNGGSAGMLADGPLGPARVAKMGTIIMAHRTGIPVIPVVWSADRRWILNSWDRFLIPKPFARIAVYIGEPLWIPEEAENNELENYRKLIESRLNQAVKLCDEHFGGELPWRKLRGEETPEIGPFKRE